MKTERYAFLMSCWLLCSALASSQNQPKTITMLLPEHKGALQIIVGDQQIVHEIKESGLRPDGKQFRFRANGEGGWNVSAFVEIAPHPGGSNEVRESWFKDTTKNSKFKLNDVKQWEAGNSAIGEYLIREALGYKVNQKHWHAYFGGEEIWSEVHVSKISYQAKDEGVFASFLQNVRSLPSYTPTSFNYFLFGSAFYQGMDYQRAALYYQRSLDLEKQQRTLDPKLWKVLLDNLTMAYGIPGDLKRAKEVVEYGISQDPEYPLFYYNMACIYGEMNDRDNAIVYLKKAFALRRNALPGEKMPDPMADDSFKRFTKDEAFVKAVKELPRD